MKTKLISLFFLLTSLSFGLEISDGEFIDNTLFSVAVYDSNIAVTPKGAVNFATILSSSKDSLSWKGVKEITLYGDSLGGLSARTAIILSESFSVTVLNPENIGDVKLLFSNLDGDEIDGRNHSVIRDYSFRGSAISNDLEFYGFNGVFYQNSCYLSAYDGGILIFNADSNADNGATGVLIPGDDTTYLSDDFILETELADSLKVLAVEKIGDTLFVLTNTQLWKTSFTKISWSYDSLPFEIREDDEESGFHPYGISTDGVNLYILGLGNGESVIVERKDGTLLAKIVDKSVSQIEAIDGGKLVLLEGSQASVPLSVFDFTVGLIDDNLSQQLQERITAVSGFNYGTAVYNGISFSSFDGHYTFAIATSLGLLYDDNFSLNSREKFTLIKRKVAIAGGLKEVYAVPTIMGGDVERVYFEYALSADDKVTINIYDYNLDFVAQIIRSETRLKGSSNSSGHSSNGRFDYWDGTVTNRGGRQVAPGLYYFRISAEKGGQAFGKVIIAKD